MNKRRYWGFRIDTAYIEVFKKELDKGYLRQGWGYDEGQNLKNLTVDEGAKRNLPMLNVKKGDILLVPRLPSWEQVAVVEATADWESGYKFEIVREQGDFGHMFPAKLLTSFVRNNEKINADIRYTLRARQRFWNIDQYHVSVDKIIAAKGADDLQKSVAKTELTENAIKKAFNDVFNEKNFSDNLFTNMSENFQGTEWENMLVHGLRTLFPFYQVEQVGGCNEEKHGTDILIKMPDIMGESSYAVAIQVKDYKNMVNEIDLIEQISKADSYWDEQENLKLVDKILLLTKSNRDENPKLVELAREKGVKLVMREEFKHLLCQMGKNYLGLSND